MPLYAGSFSKSVWYGVLREAKYPYYVCTHAHVTRSEAQNCSREAKRAIDAATEDWKKAGSPPNDSIMLPPGWREY